MPKIQWAKSATPGFWLDQNEFIVVRQALQNRDVEALLVMRFDEVSPDDDALRDTALIGELTNLLSAHGVRMPKYYSRPFRLFLVDRPDAERISAALSDLVQQSSAEDLSNDDALILYRWERDAIQKGLAYLQRALILPQKYAALLLFAT